MSAPTNAPAPRRASPRILLVLQDLVLTDYLRQVLDTRGFDVVAVAGIDAALARIDRRDVGVDVVIADWGLAGGARATLYRAAVDARLELRDQFVFLARQRPAEIERVIRARVSAVDPWDVESLIRAVEEAARRAAERQSAKLTTAEVVALDDARPTMVLVQACAAQLMAMKQFFADYGFEVTAVDSGNAAIAQLQRRRFDVLVSGWDMPDGSGAELYAYLREHHPSMASRAVFLSEGPAPEVAPLARGCPVIPKGQDSPALLRTLARIVRAS